MARRKSVGGLLIISLMAIGVVLSLISNAIEFLMAIGWQLWIAAACLVLAIVFLVDRFRPNERRTSKQNPSNLPGDPEAPSATVRSSHNQPPSPAKQPVTEAAIATVVKPAAAPAGNRMPGRWLGPGETVELAGVRIEGGMIYVGNVALSAGLANEPSRINPALDVSTEAVALHSDISGFGADYGAMSPTERKAYLLWLAGGRSDPNAPAELVLLYFMGLERRLLVDCRHDDDAKLDAIFIMAELQRLTAVYGHHHMISNAVGNLRDYLNCVSFIQGGAPLTLPTHQVSRGQLPLSLGVTLRELLKHPQPLSSEWACFWGVAIVQPRAAARSPALFKSAFTKRYSQMCGQGIAVTAPSAFVDFRYQPTSFALGLEYCEPVKLTVPQPKACEQMQVQLKAVVDAAMQDIDRYSRYVAKNACSEAALEAQLLLPQWLQDPALQSSLRQLQQVVAQGQLMITWEDLLSRLHASGNLVKGERGLLADLLAAYQIATEPHLGLCSKALVSPDLLVLYPRQADDQPEAVQEVELSLVEIGLDLACIVLHSDIQHQDSRKAYLLSYVDKLISVTPAQRHRLIARLTLSFTRPPALAPLRKLVAPLSANSKQATAKLLTDMASAGDGISAATVRMLEKLYPMLDQDLQQLYSGLHSPSRASYQPPMPGEASPVPAAGFSLDTERIAALQRESQSVAALLATVFVDESPLPADSGAGVDQSTSDATQEKSEHTGMCGLDPEHSHLLRQLITKPEWTRAEGLVLAAQIGLMLDGALEMINDSMLDLFDELLIDGDDPIQINQDLLEQLPS